MPKKSSFFQIAKGISFIGQVGFSVITPILVFTYGTYALVVKKGGSSVWMIPAVLLGLIIGLFSAKSFCKDMIKSNEIHSDKEEKSISYNKHI